MSGRVSCSSPSIDEMRVWYTLCECSPCLRNDETACTVWRVVVCPAPVQERLLAAGATAAARKAQIRSTLDAAEQAATTFKPTINNNAAAL